MALSVNNVIAIYKSFKCGAAVAGRPPIGFCHESLEVTLLRLIFDDTWQPRHFTKLYDNDKAKIYEIDY